MLEISEPSTSRLRHIQALPQTIIVQGRIRATGAAVSLPEHRDTHTCISLDSEKRGHCLTTVGLTPRADCLESETQQTRATRLPFLEDFTFEHSLHGLQITPIEHAGIFRTLVHRRSARRKLRERTNGPPIVQGQQLEALKG